MKQARFLPTLCLVASALLSGTAAPAAADTREQLTLQRATTVLEDMQRMPDLRVPGSLLARAEAVVVMPEVIKFGIGFGGRYGTGVMLTRRPDGQWSNPVFVSLAGGSWGLQLGGQATDIVLVFTTRQSVEGITDGKITLGADAAVAAGPVGRAAMAATSPQFDAEIYSFSRTRGLFAGVSLEGSALSISRKANAAFYAKPGVTAAEIMGATAPAPPPPAPTLVSMVARLTNDARAEAAAAAAMATPASAATTQPAPGGQPEAAPASAPQTGSGGKAQTFPLEDPSPGSEPRPKT